MEKNLNSNKNNKTAYSGRGRIKTTVIKESNSALEYDQNIKIFNGR
jgi:hypothetical protein